MNAPAHRESLVHTIRAGLGLLTPRERRQFRWVMAAGVLTAALETAGVASILPFMAIVMSPDVLVRYPQLAKVAGLVGAETWREAVLFSGFATGAIVAFGNAARAAGGWLQWRFEAQVRHRLSSELLRAFLYAPYSLHTRRDAPSLMTAIGHNVNGVISNILGPVLAGASRAVMVLALLGVLAVQSATVAATAFVTLGVAYSLVFRMTRVRQSKLGERAHRADYEWRLTSLEAFGGIKELTVLERRETTSERFANADRQIAELYVSRKVTEAFPRQLLEVVTLISILAVTIFLLGPDENGASAAIPTVTLYAFVGYRLMPGLQQLYGCAMSLRYGMHAVRALRADWMETGADSIPHSETQMSGFSFVDRIALTNVTFSYPGATRPALTDISLDIRRGESIGLVGRTGAGKSTLADLLLGLSEPDIGSVTVDGAALTRASMFAWRRQVGYVAQHIFLANTSVCENIAFGLRGEDIDHDAVKAAAKLAQIDEFVEALPLGYATVVGERGVRLSGGERQRLGIARALYARPSVLIFDEATSALDGLTEEAVMEAIQHLSGERTVILIAHRLRTLEACDRLVLLDAGRVIAVGSFAELTASSEAFARFLARS